MIRQRSNNDFNFITEESILSSIFTEVKDPRISAVCELWNKVNTSFLTYQAILASYRQQKPMRPLTKSLPYQIPDEDVCKFIGRFYHCVWKLAKGAGIEKESIKDLAPLDLAPVMKMIEDSALIVLFNRLILQLPEAKESPFLGENTSLKAEGIRRWMEENPEELEKITELDLEKCHLFVLPQEIGYLTNLCILKLSENHLHILPMNIVSLNKLKALDLSNNELTEVTPFIGELKCLVVLDLSHNKLKEVPVEIGRLTYLRDLYLCHNDISALPFTICQLTRLEVLRLSSNKLTTLPWTFHKLNSLEELYLSNNQFKMFPVSICKLLLLRELWLNDNQIESVPDTISCLTELKTLALHNNWLTRRPNINLKRISLQNNFIPYLFSLKDSHSK